MDKIQVEKSNIIGNLPKLNHLITYKRKIPGPLIKSMDYNKKANTELEN